ncbi:unnamed protein product [Absidia cylindrospora]
MSFDIDWSKLDDELAGYVQQFLNRHFQAINKPAFIGDIHVTSFDWGTTPPTIEIVDITNPFPEFYEPEETEDDLDTDSPSKTVNSTGDSKNSANPSVTHQPLSSSPTNTGDPLFDSLENSSKHQYSEPPSSLSGVQQQQQQHQQRIQLLHSFHRSPLVAPQHPFNNTRPMPSRSGSYFSPSPTSPTNSSYFDQRFASPFIDNRQAWIDDQNRLLNPEMANSSSPLSALDSNPSPPPPSAPQTTSVPLQDISATQMDFQAHLLVSYKGDMSMTVLTELRMNYPSMIFMSLPIQLRVRSVEFEATALVAYIQSMNRVCVSMLEADDEEVVSLRGKSAVGLESLLRQVQIESVVGDEQKHVLKNVGKIERFIVDQLRKMLDDELVFPSYQCVELGP